ncbi:AraC family transcriptional regulator [Nocardioides glacieisoli]|uniref:AraC family transcriptional regulator n=1 Tax=Nocardioides glacieisoli TaxID=1168730 RepID=A0A4Q2RR69_9ACTN|nr:helix-turn-helix domain-containing protein [Nocardioides glacieisoli]RYB90229.1 AraC family transcriptional regulator [Nocardioides glacieisoli]
MPQSRSRRGSPDSFGFEGSGDEARAWLDTVYGTELRVSSGLGVVKHDRIDHGDVVFDHVRIDASYSFDSDPMPMLVVVDVLSGMYEFAHDGVTDRITDGGSALVAGWDMPFSGSADHPVQRTTSLSWDVMLAAVEDADPQHPRRHIIFTSYVPRSPAAGARWRATVDQVGAMLPGDATPAQEHAAARLLGHTLLHTFANNVVVRPSLPGEHADDVDDSPSTVQRASRIIEDHASEDLTLGELARECNVTPRALQYAFRTHLGCTPQDYLRRVRLDLARQALRDGSAETVTDAAIRNGFFNPGRFAAYYRDQYDENPGDTLSRTTTP